MTTKNNTTKTDGDFKFPVTCKLEYPIQDGDKAISELTITGKKRLTAGDAVKAASYADNHVAATIFYLSLLTDLPVETIEQLDHADYTKLVPYVNDFL